MTCNHREPRTGQYLLVAAGGRVFCRGCNQEWEPAGMHPLAECPLCEPEGGKCRCLKVEHLYGGTWTEKDLEPDYYTRAEADARFARRLRITSIADHLARWRARRRQ